MIHDFSFFDGSTGSDHYTDAVHPGWCHTDGIECMGGKGMEFVGNCVRCYISRTSGTPTTALNGGYPNGNYTNGVTIAPKMSTVSGFTVSQNWLEGGDVLLQIAAQKTGYDTGNNGEISSNRCGADQKPLTSGRYIQMRATSGVGTYSGLPTNTFDFLDSVPAALRGQPLVAQFGGGTSSSGFSYSIVK